MDNVVDIFSKKGEDDEEAQEPFMEIMEKNKRNEEKIKAERAKKNKAVLAAYKIKHSS